MLLGALQVGRLGVPPQRCALLPRSVHPLLISFIRAGKSLGPAFKSPLIMTLCRGKCNSSSMMIKMNALVLKAACLSM